MTPAQRIRSLVDQLNKQQAGRPRLPQGSQHRMQEETINTGANARGLAGMATKKAAVGTTTSLADLMTKCK